MQLLELTLDDPYQNIALDEALLETNERGEADCEVLRLWHPSEPLVVMGRSSSLSREVNLDYCQREQIPVIRRCSGGATIVTGPGCLMYAVLLSYRKRPELRMLEQAHRFVMSTIQAAIGSLGVSVEFQGTSDLTMDNRKFSGNALRCKKDWLLYHGTLLYGMNLEWITDCLGQPERQPDYRADRSHAEFVGQIPVSVDDLSHALVQQWDTHEPLDDWPRELTASLAASKYS
ncbi:MAG: lipoate--protein ligase family protein, partial [Mariniblastus sp.]|nr:lipoate--protein ligase family protein [Mariniblastus sp.]